VLGGSFQVASRRKLRKWAMITHPDRWGQGEAQPEPCKASLILPARAAAACCGAWWLLFRQRSCSLLWGAGCLGGALSLRRRT